jgi:hypothetical protein
VATIEIDCLLRHCTDTSIVRQTYEWQALKAVKLIKGVGINGTFNFQITGRGGTLINPSTQHIFVNEVCFRAGLHIRQKYGTNLCIVPIPNSDGTISSRKSFRTLDLAQAISKSVGVPCTASDVIRWSQNPGMAHKGERARSAREHKDKLRMLRRTQRPIILFDDVVTSGSQMYAAKSLLEESAMYVAGMVAFAEVVNNGVRSDAPTWRTTSRDQYIAPDMFDVFG